VAAIEHTYEDGAVAFPDGRVFPLSLKSVNFYKTLGRPETHAWEQGRDDVWAADIRFVLDQVSVSPTSNKMYPLLALLHSELEVPQNHSLPLPQSCLAREVGLIWTLRSSDMSLAFPTRAT
jgi:hypothetical protein